MYTTSWKQICTGQTNCFKNRMVVMSVACMFGVVSNLSDAACVYATRQEQQRQQQHWCRQQQCYCLCNGARNKSFLLIRNCLFENLIGCSGLRTAQNRRGIAVILNIAPLRTFFPVLHCAESHQCTVQESAALKSVCFRGFFSLLSTAFAQAPRDCTRVLGTARTP